MDARTTPGTWRKTAAVALALAATSGCVFGNGGSVAPGTPGTGGTPGVDPRGTDAMLSFSWVINGQDPRGTAGSDPCQAAGVQFIRMSVVDGQDQTHTYSTFQWDCHLGSHRSARPELRAGMFNVYWEAVTADGRRISLAPARVDPTTSTVVPAPEPATFVLGQVYDFDQGNTAVPGTPGHPTNFATGAGSLDVNLTYAPGAPGDGGAGDGGTASGGTCTAARIATITWQLRASNGVAVEDHTTSENCMSYQHIRWDRVNWDDYSLGVTARDSTGTVILQGDCLNLLAGSDPARSVYACTVRPGT